MHARRRNRLEISVTLNPDPDRKGEAFLDIHLTVDGNPLHDTQEHWVDPVDLAMSAGLSGEMFLYTCSCGDPSCVGIDEGILVSHEPGQVIWKVREPLAWNPDEPLPEWTHDVEYHFERRDYVSQVRQAISRAKELVRSWRAPLEKLWVGPDLSADELLALDIPHGFGAAVEVDDRMVQ